MVMTRHAGFTLIELMLVVAVVGILAAIAYPSYQEQVRQTRRAEVASLVARAVPGGIMARDVCAEYSLDQVGQRTPADSRCWRR